MAQDVKALATAAAATAEAVKAPAPAATAASATASAAANSAAVAKPTTDASGATATAGAAAAAAATATTAAPATYNCTACGKAIFLASDLVKTIPLWDLGEYRASTHVIRDAIRLHDATYLRRYDCSLHEGWYCCRFTVMRMTHDKFGTGKDLLVYADSVALSTQLQGTAAAANAAAGVYSAAQHSQTRLTAKDYAAVLAAPQNRDRLCWVKYGAIWCPPCRLMDTAIHAIVTEGKAAALSGAEVAFFEVDIDAEQALAAQWSNEGIPFVVLYWNGAQLKLDPKTDRHDRVVDGGLTGGMGQAQIVALAKRCYAAAKAGKTLVSLT